MQTTWIFEFRYNIADVNHNLITKTIVTAAIPLRYSRFGRGSGRVLLDYLQCAGSEKNLLECRRSRIGATCGVYSIAGVQCAGNETQGIG